jgi:hypothetical protein
VKCWICKVEAAADRDQKKEAKPEGAAPEA